MATMAISAGSVAAGVSRDDWITPEGQLWRLADTSKTKNFLTRVCQSAQTKPLVKDRPIIKAFRYPIPTYIAHWLDPKLTNWHTALKRIEMLPDRIPPLPENIHEILNAPCPIHTEKKEDGTPIHKVIDTHVLYLIPACSVNDLEARVEAYGEAHLAEFGGRNPLQFSFFWDEARLEHGNTSSEPQWCLMSKDLLPESRNKIVDAQMQMVEDLSKRAGVNYERASLIQAVGVPFFHKIATGESLLQTSHEGNGHKYTYTRVKEVTRGWPLVVGGFAPGGLLVYDDYYGDRFIGVLALRKF